MEILKKPYHILKVKDYCSLLGLSYSTARRWYARDCEVFDCEVINVKKFLRLYDDVTIKFLKRNNHYRPL